MCPLPFLGVPQWGSWPLSYFVGGFSFWVSPLVIGPLSPWSLEVSFLRSLFGPFHWWCCSCPWFILSVLLVSALGLFACLVGLSLSLHWVVVALFLRLSEVSHSISTSDGALLLSFGGLSCHLCIFLASTSSLLSRSFRPWLGLLFRCVFLVCVSSCSSGSLITSFGYCFSLSLFL